MRRGQLLGAFFGPYRPIPGHSCPQSQGCTQNRAIRSAALPPESEYAESHTPDLILATAAPVQFAAVQKWGQSAKFASSVWRHQSEKSGTCSIPPAAHIQRCLCLERARRCFARPAHPKPYAPCIGIHRTNTELRPMKASKRTQKSPPSRRAGRASTLCVSGE